MRKVLVGGKWIDFESFIPPGSTNVHWTARRKRVMLAAVDSGEVSETEASEKYAISSEELQSWRDSLTRHGYVALQATKISSFRPQ